MNVSSFFNTIKIKNLKFLNLFEKILLIITEYKFCISDKEKNIYVCKIIDRLEKVIFSLYQTVLRNDLELTIYEIPKT